MSHSVLQALQRAFIKHDEEKDKLIMEERAKVERLIK
jgi:hypothetical protein